MRYLLDDVNDWLKFAEGKHAILIGFNGGLIGLVTAQWEFSCWEWSTLNIYYVWAIILLAGAVCCSILSFLPQLTPSSDKDIIKKNLEARQNPLFFGDVAEMTSDELLMFFNEESEYKNKNVWIAQQAINNSQIAVTKFKLFRVALWLSFFAILPPVALVVVILRKIL